ncbi:MAG: outer membrane protein, partial [Oceanicaulis sp.]
YSPSDVAIIEDTEMVGFYQLMAGGSYAFGPDVEAFAGYRYRQSGDAETDSVLVPAGLDIENQNHILEFGLRYSF